MASRCRQNARNATFNDFCWLLAPICGEMCFTCAPLRRDTLPLSLSVGFRLAGAELLAFGCWLVIGRS
eukprot:4550683-Alexandrium_andersonii.AAC.1